MTVRAARLFFERRSRFLDLAVLDLDAAVLLLEQHRLLFELLVRLLSSSCCC
jgi:hypothetical protein